MWASFHKHREALTNRDVLLRLWLRMFNSDVSQVSLFGLICISLTHGLLRTLYVLQRRSCVVSLGEFESLMNIRKSLSHYEAYAR